MEWVIERDEHGNSAAEGVGDGVRINVWLHPDLQDEVRITTSTEHGSSGVWVPSSILASVIPGLGNRDCHDLRNAVQVLMLAESDADVLAAGLEIRGRVSAMKRGDS